MHKFAVALTATGMLAFSTIASTEVIVSDSFESGDFAAPGYPKFQWADGNAGASTISIVTMTPEGDPKILHDRHPEDTVLTGDPRDWTAKNGDNSLMMRYMADSNWTELRFGWDEPMTELWLSFWLRVPTNFAHPEVDGADNQKLLRLWMDGYGRDGDGTTLGLSFRGDGQGGSYFFAKVNGSGDKGPAPFISIPGDRGRWMHLVIHVKSEDSPGEQNGMMEVWRKWEDNADYIKTHDFQNHHLKLSSTVKGFTKGYLMGYANAAYPVDTEFLIDDFEVSTSPLFANSNAPNAPLSIAIK